VPEDDQVSIARLLADAKVGTVAAAVSVVSRQRSNARGGPFEVRQGRYRIVEADPSDWSAAVDLDSVSLILTYVPAATDGVPVWYPKAPAHYTVPVVEAHRQLRRWRPRYSWMGQPARDDEFRR